MMNAKGSVAPLPNTMATGRTPTTAASGATAAMTNTASRKVPKLLVSDPLPAGADSAEAGRVIELKASFMSNSN
ncbi:hypothetical protein D3C84_633770 [compost metagenome]